ARPVGVFADVDAVERRYRDEDATLLHQLWHVPVEEGEQQRRDVVTVGVGVGQQHHPLVAHPRQIEIRADAAAQRRYQIGQLLVLEHLGQRQSLGVEHLAAQRQDRLRIAIAALFGGAAGGLAFDDEQ